MQKKMALIITWMVMILSAEADNRTTNNGFTLARDGKPAATIVLAGQPTRAAQFAAAELQYHLGKITGVALPIVTNVAEATGVRVFVGESEATRAMGLKNDGFTPQEYLIGFRKEGLVLMGRDKDDRKQIDYLDEKTFPDGFDEQGTCYATYDFLEKFCGVRWYLPTELGLVYTPTNTLSVSGQDIRRQPFMWYREIYKDLGIPADLCGDTVNATNGTPQEFLDAREAVLWSRRNRMGGRPYKANHSLYGYYDRFLKTHPEWFAQGYEGTPPQMCYTSTGLIAQVVQDARDYFDGKRVVAVAKGDYFAVVPMDNLNFCKCQSCQALIKHEGMRGSGAFTDGTSDYMFSFVNRVAREIGKTHPDKYISTAAYHGYAYPPAANKMETNVAVTLALYTRSVFNRQKQENDARRLDAWSREAPDVTKLVWLYFCYPSLDARDQKYRCFPGFFATALIERLKEYHRHGVRGFFIEPAYLAGVARSVLMDQLELYLMRKLADDPELDGQALKGEFFERYYGAAAKPMRELYLGIERVYCDDTIPYPDQGRQTEEMAWGQLGTESRMKEYGKLMAAAHTLAKTDMEKKRVALFDKGIWQYMLAGRKAYLETVELRKSTWQSARVPRVYAASNDLDQTDWLKGSMLTNWLTWTGAEPESKIKAEGCALHDGQFLYLRLTAQGDPERLKTENQSWRHDGWWLYFARQRLQPYLQLLIGQDGGIIMRYHGKNEPVTEYKVNERHKTINEPGRRVMVIALPLSGLLPGGVKPGETIYFNIMRANPDRGYLAWIPPFAADDAPSRFGEFILDK